MLNIPKKELEILDFWKKHGIFQKSLDKESPKGDYVFYDGPPFATGLPHYGHILSSVIKDVVPRYWTMKGYHVRRRWGWDCHGLPIETLVEKKLKISGKKEIEKLGVDKFNEACRKEVLTYTAQWKDMVERIGRWIEFDTAYKTMDTTYMESVWWALRQLWDKKLIYEGRKVLLFCPRCETPVSKFEIAMDNSYHDVDDISVTVKFKLDADQKIGDTETSDGTYILAWTTTPWTLPGNVALAVGEGISYGIWTVKDAAGHSGLKKGDTLIFADEGDVVERVRSFIAHDPVAHDAGVSEPEPQLEKVATVKGGDLIDKTYEPLYKIPAVQETKKKSHYIAAADFVTTEEGTGVVHTAVIYGEDDYSLGVKLDLPMVPLLDTQGRFTARAPKLVQTMNFKEADEIVTLDLQQRGLLYKQESYRHSYPHCWRCESPLFYNAIQAWFIDIQKIKDKLIKLNEKINWYPEHLKHGRFLDNVQNAPDWNISRNRYWASALPFWKCDKEECTEVVCIGSIAELKEKATNFSDVYKSDSVDDIDLHKHVIDKVKLKCSKCGGTMSRIPEVLDCWVESGSMPFAEFHYPFENKETFEQRLPAQYIAEYIAQTRTWFYYMHVMAVALFNSISFENVVTTGTILNEKGQKMSKSKRNFPDPWKVIEDYGADSLRFHLMTSVVMQAENLNFNEKEVREVYNKVISTIYNVVSFYQLYANDKEPSNQPPKSDNVLDRWIVALLHQLTRTVTQEMDAYNTVRATRALASFINDLSTWYLRRSRDRFKNEATRQDAVNTLGYVLKTVSQLLAPLIPYTAEYIWKAVASENAESVHLESWPKESSREKAVDALEISMQKVRAIVEKAHALRAAKGIKVRQPLAELEIIEKLDEAFLMIIADEVNVKSVSVEKKVSDDKGKVCDEGKTISLHIELTDELKAEGALRELIRMTNSLRKDKGLKPQDVVEVSYYTSSKFLNEKVVGTYIEQLKKQTVASAWNSASSTLSGKEVTVNNEKITIAL